MDLEIDVEKVLRADIAEMIEKDTYPNDYLRYTCKLYQACADVNRRNRAGIRPAAFCAARRALFALMSADALYFPDRYGRNA